MCGTLFTDERELTLRKRGNKMKKFSNDDQNNLDSVGFDTTTFDEITEQEIRDYFTDILFLQMMGHPRTDDGDPVDSWSDIIDFESFIDAAIDECTENGSLK
jgi:hypothetical protein